jgi:hypothetical protein
MQIINEDLRVENKELFPQILMRIFSVCKADKNFPLKEKIESVEKEIRLLEAQINKKSNVLDETKKLRDGLGTKLQSARQENFELKTKLLEELGSGI